ncbi:MAG: helix-turn-helix domain-containing protein [Hoeflea sp.]|nr:helix-turn-helix domain-containing protein [Hoeflea sp.]
MEWASAALPSRERFEAWRHALDATHLPWTLGRATPDGFSASLRALEMDGMRIVDCVCDPCEGHRDRSDIRRGDDGWYGVLMVRKGRERVEQGDQAFELAAGSTLIWDASRPISFAVLEPLEKCTLLVSRAFLKRETGLPGLPVGLVDSARGFGALLHKRASGLGQVIGDFDKRDQVRLGQGLLLDLTHAVEGTLRPSAVPPRTLLLHRITRIIDLNFAEPELDPGAVAAAAGISVRHLHGVLEEAGETAGARILRRRLEALRHALSDPGFDGASITQIGFASGFSNASHISRAFRERYGVTPSQYRKRPH